MPPVSISRLHQTLSQRSDAVAITELKSQWRNPSDVLSVLLLIGGDIIQKALAQFAGGSGIYRLTPVCFSFGWVSLAFTTIVSIVGDGRLVPAPDYSCKLISVASGYVRESRSWILGRLLRDGEDVLNDEGDEPALCITVYNAVGGKEVNGTKFPPAGTPLRGITWYSGFVIMLAQLIIAAIPGFVDDDWSTFIVTVAGTLLAMLTGILPQWQAEKYSCKTTSSKKQFILTGGNGTRHAIAICGSGEKGNCLDLEDLAAAEGPRLRRPWDRFGWFTKQVYDRGAPMMNSPTSKSSSACTRLYNRLYRQPKNKTVLSKMSTSESSVSPSQFEKKNTAVTTREISILSKPADFHFTRIFCFLLAILWILLLITVAGLQQNSWYLLIAGTIGMVQNAFLAGMKLEPSEHGIHLELVLSYRTAKVMWTLMDLERDHPKMGTRLLEEFFPGKLHDAEKKWWQGDREEYDLVREKQDRQFMRKREDERKEKLEMEKSEGEGYEKDENATEALPSTEENANSVNVTR